MNKNFELGVNENKHYIVKKKYINLALVDANLENQFQNKIKPFQK